MVRYSRYSCFQMAEVSLTGELSAAILRRVRRLLQPFLGEIVEACVSCHTAFRPALPAKWPLAASRSGV